MLMEKLLIEYKENVKQITRNAQRSGLNENQIDKLLEQSFVDLKNSNSNRSFLSQIIHQNVLKLSVFVILFFSLFIYVLLNVHTPTSSLVLRNVQGLTYPALKIVRTLSVPIIQWFPSLTDLYDESCLVENPFYYEFDMSCWHCNTVHSVMDLTGIKGISPYDKEFEGIPFLIKTDQKEILFQDLQELYSDNSAEFSHDSRRISLNNIQANTLSEVFSIPNGNLSSDVSVHWRINKMTAARIIRKLFPKPHILPERSGQSVERFLYIDGPASEPYRLPNTECGYGFLIQGAGERTVVLESATECSHKCKTVSVVMKPSYVLFYSWWHWRPISLPTKGGSSLSISYLNSFC